MDEANRRCVIAPGGSEGSLLRAPSGAPHNAEAPGQPALGRRWGPGRSREALQTALPQARRHERARHRPPSPRPAPRPAAQSPGPGPPALVAPRALRSRALSAEPRRSGPHFSQLFRGRSPPHPCAQRPRLPSLGPDSLGGSGFAELAGPGAAAPSLWRPRSGPPPDWLARESKAASGPGAGRLGVGLRTATAGESREGGAARTSAPSPRSLPPPLARPGDPRPPSPRHPEKPPRREGGGPSGLSVALGDRPARRPGLPGEERPSACPSRPPPLRSVPRRDRDRLPHFPPRAPLRGGGRKAPGPRASEAWGCPFRVRGAQAERLSGRPRQQTLVIPLPFPARSPRPLRGPPLHPRHKTQVSTQEP
ncbi:translation initiation factor IF-2-like [Ursus maritimus]|uniref:Translation initiation factor IF-2-like n=1 Tax=Ursus maritimus TaxID=29073 RepID=A0A8M1FGW9_URSMA|nr:translation initiation factor IF-2-like [Ursus maritimus]